MNRISTNAIIGFTPKFKTFTFNIRGKLFVADRPLVMGIINSTPDSFYKKSRVISKSEIKDAIHRQIASGVDIIDIGGFSTRPGAEFISIEEEKRRIEVVLNEIRKINSEILVSIDTFRSEIAEFALSHGGDIINDISGGRYDNNMYKIISEYNIPYIIMHSFGVESDKTPDNDYEKNGGVTASIIKYLADSIQNAKQIGIKDIIIDPGFGFSKNIEENYTVLKELPIIKEALDFPILVGISRKSMLYKPLGTTPEESLAATITANTIALLMGASIIRVHDPLPARQTIDIISKTYNSYLQ